MAEAFTSFRDIVNSLRTWTSSISDRGDTDEESDSIEGKGKEDEDEDEDEGEEVEEEAEEEEEDGEETGLGSIMLYKFLMLLK